MAAVYTPRAIAEAMLDAGFPRDEKVIRQGVAVALTESGGRSNARNYNPPEEDSWGPWQINLLAHPKVTRQCAKELACSTRYAHQLWRGLGWEPWTVYTSRAYLVNMPRARRAARLALAGRPTDRKSAAPASAHKPVAADPFAFFPVQGPHSFSNDWHAPRLNHLHEGNDIMADEGTPIVAPFAGVVIPTSQGGTCGHGAYVVGRFGYVLNCHMEKAPRVVGPVAAGTVIGYVGATGNATAPAYHDHFEWHPGGKVPGDAEPVNPYPYLRKAEGRTLKAAGKKQPRPGKKGKGPRTRPHAPQTGTTAPTAPTTATQPSTPGANPHCAKCISGIMAGAAVGGFFGGAGAPNTEEELVEQVRQRCPDCYSSPELQAAIEQIRSKEFGDTIGPIDVAKMTFRFLTDVPAYFELLGGALLILVAIWLLAKDLGLGAAQRAVTRSGRRVTGVAGSLGAVAQRGAQRSVAREEAKRAAAQEAADQEAADEWEQSKEQVKQQRREDERLRLKALKDRPRGGLNSRETYAARKRKFIERSKAA